MKRTPIAISMIIYVLMILNSEVRAQDKIKDKNTQVVHTVLFKFNESTTQIQIDSLKRGIQRLEQVIPGILEVSFGKNFSERSKGFTYAVTMKFLDRTNLEKFYVHPKHLELIKTSIKPIIVDMAVIDFEEELNQ